MRMLIHMIIWPYQESTWTGFVQEAGESDQPRGCGAEAVQVTLWTAHDLVVARWWFPKGLQPAEEGQIDPLACPWLVQPDARFNFAFATHMSVFFLSWRCWQLIQAWCCCAALDVFSQTSSLPFKGTGLGSLRKGCIFSGFPGSREQCKKST